MRALAIVILAAGCGSDGTGEPDPQFDAGPDANPDPRFDLPRGEFAVVEGAEVIGGEARTYASITGFVLTEPQVGFHSEVDRQGPCRFLTFEPGFCDGCDGICDAKGQCRPFAERESIGAVRIEGLTGGDQSLTEPIDGYYQHASPLPDDIFDLNSTIRLVGGDLSITAGGPAKLSGEPVGERLTLVDGSDAVIRWTPGERGDRVRLVLRSSNQAHGLPPDAIIECDSPDTGELTIPRAWVEQFPDSSGERICVSVDCPPSELRRYRVGSAGDIDLIVASERSFMVAH